VKSSFINPSWSSAESLSKRYVVASVQAAPKPTISCLADDFESRVWVQVEFDPALEIARQRWGGRRCAESSLVVQQEEGESGMDAADREVERRRVERYFLTMAPSDDFQ
jgi:hypothetical protein